MNSLSKKKATQNWIDDKYDNQEKQKTHHLAVKLQTGMTLIIKTKLLQKAKKSLKELRVLLQSFPKEYRSPSLTF
jgi:hypothetical protein